MVARMDASMENILNLLLIEARLSQLFTCNLLGHALKYEDVKRKKAIPIEPS